MSERGFGLTRKVLQTFALSVTRKSCPSVQKPNSKKWCQKFLKKYKLSLRTPNSLQRSRVAVSSQETIDEYFKLLDSTINKLDLQDKPSQIWNADEAGFGKETDQIKQKIISPTGTKNPYRQQMTDYEHITLLACASAAGGFMPNMLIFTKSLPCGRYASEMPKDWLYATAENGYITRDLFENWFEKVFIPSIGLRRPNLLIIDNHSSHLSIPVIDMAIEHNIEILGLPPHTAHFLQPLDQIFHQLRSGYSELALNIGLVKADMVIKKNTFAIVLQQAQDKAWSPHVIKQGFRKTGLYPLNSTAIDKSFIRPNPTTTIQTEDPSLKNVETTLNDTCKTCGRAITNPLVKAGLVDKDLHDILVLEDITKSDKPNNKRLTGARIYTGQEMRDELKRKAEEQKEKEEGLKQRKAIAEDDEDDEMFTCGVCATRGKKTDEQNGILWVGCDRDGCPLNWYHYDCLSRDDQLTIDMSLLFSEVKWLCPVCVEEE
ncbi:unnamed protein product [Mytilus coruscus]|uniref:PHD-type domain-containing protein n=1 Tax=Mytilus coruscus TaxID=42192 RepID=A0A6J8B0F1_MYTCO|nr:unnamed protein product [Mytilus coruscus]